MLTPADQQVLLTRFEKVERESIGVGKHANYEKIVGELEREIAKGSTKEPGQNAPGS